MIQKPDYTLTQSADQPSWKILVAGKEIGRVWIDTEGTDDVAGPSVFIETTDSDHAREAAVLKDTIRYAYGNLPYAELFTRYTVNDSEHAATLRTLGFEADEKPYADDAGVQWQNVKLVL